MNTRTPHPHTTTAFPPIHPAIRTALFELDDALSILGDAIDVIEVLTEDHVSNKATHPLHDQHRRMRAQIHNAFAAMRGEVAA